MMSGRSTARSRLATHAEVRAVLRWLRVTVHRQLVRESAVWRAWPALRDSDPATALVVLALALRGPVESIPGRKLPNPDRAEVVVVLAYLRGVAVLPDLAPVAEPWTWGDLARLAAEMADTGGDLAPYWRSQTGDGEAARSIARSDRPLLMPRPKNLGGWARLALAGVGI
jgi:hypothetical protein